MSLWLLNALLVLLVVLALLKPLFTRHVGTAASAAEDAARRALLVNRLVELEREYAVGLLDVPDYTQARRETESAYTEVVTEADAAADAARTPVAAVVAVLVFVTAAAVSYFYFSEGYRILLAQERAASVMEEFEKTREALAARVAEQPRDSTAWLLLARLDYRFGDYAAAAAEYRRVDELRALESPVAWMDYADALLRSGGAARGARVLEMLEQALAAAPRDQRGLFLAGMLSFERREHARAVEHWQRLLALTPDEKAEVREELQLLIARAQRAQTLSPEDTARGAIGGVAEEPSEESGAAVTVTVRLAESVRGRAQPGDTVFVYARALEGPPMPLAIVRLSVAELPATVRLDESGAMMAGLSLGAFERVEIVARVSRRGQATPVAGDLSGSVSPAAVGDVVEVLISEVVE